MYFSSQHPPSFLLIFGIYLFFIIGHMTFILIEIKFVYERYKEMNKVSRREKVATKEKERKRMMCGGAWELRKNLMKLVSCGICRKKVTSEKRVLLGSFLLPKVGLPCKCELTVWIECFQEAELSK